MNLSTPPTSRLGRLSSDSEAPARLSSAAKALLGFHAVLVVVLVVLLELSPAPLHTALLRWDAVWYDSIRREGYLYSEGNMNSTAFFPLFPYAWRWSTLKPIGICLLNLGVFSGALVLLYRRLKLRPEALLLFTAFPTSLFFYMPYTEAFFFFASSVVLLGIAEKKPRTLMGGLLVGAFTRVTSFFFLPSLLVLEALHVRLNPGSVRQRVLQMFLYGSVTGFGLASAMLIQWAQTGTWFAFNKTQADFLNHHLRFPTLPFVSNTTTLIVWLDGLALLTGLCAGGWALLRIIRAWRRTAEAPPATVLFSTVFISVTALYTLAYAPVAKDSTSTSLLSMHRYVFGTPFFLILLNAALPRVHLRLRPMLLWLVPVLLLTACLGLLNGQPVAFYFTRSPVIVPGFIYAAFVLVFSALWLQSGSVWCRRLIYGSGIIMQFLFAYLHTVGVWIG